MTTEEIMTALGDKTLTAVEFHDLLPARMSDMQKANHTKKMAMQGLIEVSVFRGTDGKMTTSVKKAANG